MRLTRLPEEIFIGIATPQANPTVELEMRSFFRPPVQPLFTRLTSKADAPNERLVEYLEQLPQAAASFDSLPLRVFGFACTASSYLLGHEREEEIVETVEQQLRVQVITATQAIRRELQGRGARRIAVLAPYPEDLCEAAVEYWASLGVEVANLERIDTGTDTRGIYDIRDNDINEALARFDMAGADLLLLSGTGMRSIAALEQADVPMLSSNLCLATEALRRTQQWPPNEAADVGRLLE